ncbi:50S ribosomal protein L10 [Allofustis seminis]|uniref:50S ribosomal protein L10 n=1 Tax=Allofustis seminis TaxID=166939 RepID=UPI00037B8708|nr:50S ribosomal protein L10 [Allofustis seminis]
MSEAVLQNKKQLVNELVEKFEKANAVVIVNYRGLNVTEVTDLRKQLREAGVEMVVAKNTMLRRAAEKMGYEGLDEVLTGPTAVAFGYEEVPAPAKIMTEFAKTAEPLVVKGGIVEGKVVTVEMIEAVAKLPSREGLLSMLLSVLQAPMRNTAYVLQAANPATKLAYALKDLAEKGGAA